MVKKLVSLFWLVLSLVGGFALGGARQSTAKEVSAAKIEQTIAVAKSGNMERLAEILGQDNSIINAMVLNADDSKVNELIIALSTSKPEIIDCFLKAGMPIDHLFRDTTLLQRAASLGLYDTVDFLLHKGAEVEVVEAAYA